MNDWSGRNEGSPTSERNSNSASGSGTQKQAACLNCRKIKTRCNRSPGGPQCRRCTQLSLECIIPAFHVGRQKGTKNKRTGLDKAVYRIKQTLERSRNEGTGQTSDPNTALQLQQLLDKTQSLLPNGGGGNVDQSNPMSMDSIISVDSIPTVEAHAPPPPLRNERSSYARDSSYRLPSRTEDNFALDDAENPLQLLARASDLPVSPPGPQTAVSPTSPASMPSRSYLERTKGGEDLDTFFGPSRPQLQLDVGEDIDPIDMGLTTVSEADALFTYFYQNLSHTRWGLDPHVHTSRFVRSRSAFLFTSILSASSLFLPSTAALSKRLSTHCKNLAARVMANRYRSPEIVLAFLINIPWMSPGKHWADDATCSYMAMALTIAVDLSLNKLITPSPSNTTDLISSSIPKSDCITAKKALALDGFDEVDPASVWGRRLLRRRERIWLALFVLDRGVCLARGRSYTVPVTPLIQICNNWHLSDIADTWDRSLISSAVLRRELVGLIADVKSSCDGDRLRVVAGSTVVQSVKDMIESFFDRWYGIWAFPIEGSRHHHLPPYVEILVSHTRLSTYGSVINHPTAPIEVKRFFHAAGLSSALNVMRAAVQGEGQLKSMPNNTVVMISFAACFALCLITMSTGNSLSLAPSIKILIEETADVLERIGKIPSHRKGMSALYGRHLRDVVRKTLPMLDQNQQPPTAPMSHNTNNPRFMGGTNGHSHPHNRNGENSGMLSFEPLLFSAMSDYQIVEAIDNAGDELQTCLPNFQIDDSTGLDWLDWFSFDNVT